jgi:hypothetical protein
VIFLWNLVGLLVLAIIGKLVTEGGGDEFNWGLYLHDVAQQKDLKEVILSSKRGPDNLVRNATTKDDMWSEPRHKPGLFKGMRHGSSVEPEWFDEYEKRRRKV